MSKLKPASKIVIGATTLLIVSFITPGLVSIYQFIYTGHSFLGVDRTMLSLMLGVASVFGYFAVVMTQENKL